MEIVSAKELDRLLAGYWTLEDCADALDFALECSGAVLDRRAVEELFYQIERRLEIEEEKVYDRGYEDGYDAGYDEGGRDAY